ncbi:hypothetical protein RF55_14655 [Lasius niger]|uniref:Mutator-like transposase domain-containing protein n=1 Tax=Lasius niger TaxID=67767 RepID=A0A0J7K7L8_LASNI|nr:hypothetical protein RF55_14655 [Lasius niger]
MLNLQRVESLRGTKLTNGTENESIKFVESMESSDKIDSNISTKVMQYEDIKGDVPGMYIEKVVHSEDNENLVIDNKGLLDTNRIQECMPKGRSIVDFSFIWTELHRTFNNHARGIECQFKDWKLIKSHREGLMTQYFFKCQMCNYEDNIWSESTEPKKLDLNQAAVPEWKFRLAELQS